jgi:CxxC-x17-CxxC domain-containing protein
VNFEDRMLRCRDCGQEFVFSAGEQAFYQQKGLLNDPARCPSCRSVRKASGGRQMSSAPREMHTAICAECGREALVPFLPQQNKPVYCSSCFERVRASR